MTLEESLKYLGEVETRNQRLDKLIRQGMLPARQLPILHRALSVSYTHLRAHET